MRLQPVATGLVQSGFQSFCSPMDWTLKLYSASCHCGTGHLYLNLIVVMLAWHQPFASPRHCAAIDMLSSSSLSCWCGHAIVVMQVWQVQVQLLLWLLFRWWSDAGAVVCSHHAGVGTGAGAIVVWVMVLVLGCHCRHVGDSWHRHCWGSHHCCCVSAGAGAWVVIMVMWVQQQ